MECSRRSNAVVLLAAVVLLTSAAAARPGGRDARDIAAAVAPPRRGTPASNCVTCHEGLPASTAGGHSFLDWRSSPHGTSGVTCSSCHGGDTTATVKTRAHVGVYPSGDRRSKVYYTRIPATCGSCHSKELGWFSESRHYNQLITTGRGPNCVTCHGSMAVSILPPEQLQQTCSACHNADQHLPVTPPIAARYLLLLLRQVDFGLGVTQALAERTPAGPRRTAATRALNDARDQMQNARAGWHSFDLQQIENMLGRTAQSVRRADSVLTISGAPRE